MYTHDIDYVIRTLGVGATYRGYRYLSYGIELCLTDEEYLLAISKQLYPEIARKYKTTVGRRLCGSPLSSLREGFRATSCRI